MSQRNLLVLFVSVCFTTLMGCGSGGHPDGSGISSGSVNSVTGGTSSASTTSAGGSSAIPDGTSPEGGGSTTTIGGSAAQTGGASSACAQNCDDGHACTIDTCVNTACRHTIGPRTGATACPAGQYCTLDSGCVAAPACATADQCVTTWKDDACKTNVQCEAASSVCTFDSLDKDKDGHSPQVCGGDDCNDGDATVYSGIVEKCNGVDDDCDGAVDEDDTGTPICGKLATCQKGACVCKTEYQCQSGTTCTDTSTSTSDCGSCGHSCGTSYGYVSHKAVGYWSCTAGTCACSATVCGTVCTDPKTDNENCGACGTVCADLDPDSQCLNGQCVRYCVYNTSITCASNEICKYDGTSSTCIPDPCPGQALSCDAPCNTVKNCSTCSVHGGSTIWCR